MITVAEYIQRINTLQSKVAEKGLDLFIVWDKESIFYLTGAVYENLERPFFILVYADQVPVLVVPQLELEHMKKVPNISRIETYFEFPSKEGAGWQDLLQHLCGAAQSIGVEPSLPVGLYNELLGMKKNMAVAPFIEDMRLIKSPDEIKMIRWAAYYADMAVQCLLKVSSYGSAVADGFAQTQVVNKEIIQDLGLRWNPLTNSVLMATWAAPRSAQPHAVPLLSDLLKEGPHVALSLTRVSGYSAECERTYFTSKPTKHEEELFATMMQARKVAFAMLRPGVSCAEIDATVNHFLAQRGYSSKEQRLHRVGHGFGLSAHEGPWISEGSDHILAENMVISVEPGIYLPELGGFRHSDTVLVTKNGYEVLTRRPVQIEELTIIR